MDQHIHVNLEAEQRSWKEIISDVIQDIENIFRNEIRLAGVELKKKAIEGAKAGAMLAVAGVMGFFAMACLITTGIVALNIVLPLWLSCLIITVLLGAGAGGAFLMGRMALQEVDPVPQKTVETLKDNVEWAKTRAKS